MLRLTFLLLLLPLLARAQVRGESDAAPPLVLEQRDSTEALAFLAEWRDRQRRRGFWEASVDSLYRNTAGELVALLHAGPVYAWSELRPPSDALAARWARRAGYRPRRFDRGRPLRPAGWTALRDSVLARAAANGYPFASVGLADIDWAAPGLLGARIDVDRGPLIRVGELRLPDNVRVRTSFLERYLGLENGAPFSDRKLRQLTGRLAQLPYLTLNGPPRVAFRDSLAFIDLPLRRRSASRFDFVIGVLPGGGTDGRLLLTGELNGELYNGFGQGERIAARFEQLRPRTQELQLAVDYPFLFGLPFGFEGELDLYRRDTAFLNLNWRLAATYLREGNDRFSFFWEQRSTIVPGLDSAQLVAGRLPDTLGVTRSFFGLQLRRSRTDRRFSPRRGYRLDLSGAAGFRRLRGVDLAPELSDSLGGRSTQFQLRADVDAYFSPLTGTVAYFGLRAAALLTPDAALANEQFRLGGARLLRGFNEQQFFATDYQVLTAEFRLLLGERAFLYLFADAARLNARSQLRPDRPPDYPLGVGAGVNFETRAGIFGLSLALGRQRGEPLDPGRPKVHLGYVSVF